MSWPSAGRSLPPASGSSRRTPTFSSRCVEVRFGRALAGIEQVFHRKTTVCRKPSLAGAFGAARAQLSTAEAVGCRQFQTVPAGGIGGCWPGWARRRQPGLGARSAAACAVTCNVGLTLAIETRARTVRAHIPHTSYGGLHHALRLAALSRCWRRRRALRPRSICGGSASRERPYAVPSGPFYEFTTSSRGGAITRNAVERHAKAGLAQRFSLLSFV